MKKEMAGARLKKLCLFLSAAMLLGVVYRLVSEITLERSHFLTLLTPLDKIMPFIPETVIIYFSIYLFWLVPILSREISLKYFWRIIITIAIAFLATFLGHLLLPSSYPRPEISETAAQSNWAEFMVKKFLHWVDPPNNTFPSSHVVTVIILMKMMFAKLGRWPYRLYCFWGTLIMLSTLTVKQHYLIDVISAAIIAFLVCFCVNKYLPEKSKTAP